MATGMNVRRILMIKTRGVVGDPTRLLTHNTNNGNDTKFHKVLLSALTNAFRNFSTFVLK